MREGGAASFTMQYRSQPSYRDCRPLLYRSRAGQPAHPGKLGLGAALKVGLYTAVEASASRRASVGGEGRRAGVGVQELGAHDGTRAPLLFSLGNNCRQMAPH